MGHLKLDVQLPSTLSILAQLWSAFKPCYTVHSSTVVERFQALLAGFSSMRLVSSAGC